MKLRCAEFQNDIILCKSVLGASMPRTAKWTDVPFFICNTISQLFLNENWQIFTSKKNIQFWLLHRQEGRSQVSHCFTNISYFDGSRKVWKANIFSQAIHINYELMSNYNVWWDMVCIALVYVKPHCYFWALHRLFLSYFCQKCVYLLSPLIINTYYCICCGFARVIACHLSGYLFVSVLGLESNS